MNYARKIAVVVALSVAVCGSSQALAAKGGGAKHTTPLESMQYVLKQLDLSAEQQTKVDDIVADLEKKAQELKQQAKSGDKEGARGKARGMVQEARERLEKVLTPEQQTKFRKLMAEEREQKKDAGKDRKHPATEPAA